MLSPVNDEGLARREISKGDLGHLLLIPEGLAATATDNPPAQITLLYDDTDPLERYRPWGRIELR